MSFEGTVNGDLVRDVTIGGLTERIPFYKVPSDARVRPMSDTTFLDLDDIERISFPGGIKSIKNFDGREYVELLVVIKGGARHGEPFLVEKERKVFCKWVTAGGLIKKELLFEALGNLEIRGFKPREDVLASGKAPVAAKPSQAREALCAQLKADLERLEKEVSKGQASEVIASMKKTIHYLCN